MVSELKKELVKKLVSKIKEFPIVGLVNFESLPAKQLQNMRAMLLSNGVEILMARKKLLELALSESKLKNIEQLKEKIKGMPALLFSKDNPFTLYAMIQKNKSPAPAKAGQTAPKDILVKGGPTSFIPGPIISELASVGIKTKVDGGKLTIIDDVTVAKEGDEISANLAGLLTRLDIQPMEVGLDLVAVWEGGTVFDAKQLRVDEEEYTANFIQAAQWAMNLAIEAAIPTADTTELLLQKAFRDAKALALEQDILTDLTAGEILGKAERQALSVKNVAGVEVGAAKPAPVEEKKEEVEETKEEPKEEVKEEAPEQTQEEAEAPVINEEADSEGKESQLDEESSEETKEESQSTESEEKEEPLKEGEEKDVPVEEIPEVVKKAVEAAVPGAEIKEAELEVEDGKTQYEVEVEKDGKKIEVEVSPSGEVLEVEEEKEEQPEEEKEEEEPVAEETPQAEEEAAPVLNEDQSNETTSSSATPADPKDDEKETSNEQSEQPEEEKSEEKEEPQQEAATLTPEMSVKEASMQEEPKKETQTPTAEDLIAATKAQFAGTNHPVKEVAVENKPTTELPENVTAESLVAEELEKAEEEKAGKPVPDKSVEEAEDLFKTLMKKGTLRDKEQK